VLALPSAAGARAAPGPIDVNCAKQDFGALRREQNLRASMILVECGKAPGGHRLSSASGGADTTKAFALGGGDVDLITGGETYPRVTQSEDMVWGQGNTVVATYNDSSGAPSNFGGASVSTDGGHTFTRLLPSPFTGHGSNFGDPTVVFDAVLGKWFAGFLATGDCRSGGSAVGIGMWQSTNGTTWTAAPCAHVGTGNGDDRDALGVDDNPSSPHFGRMYMVWNNFGSAAAPLVGSFSDNGSTWSAPIAIDPNITSFTRATGVSVAADGTVLVYGLNETSQGSAKTYKVFRSTDGGVTYGAGINMAAGQTAPGQTGGSSACAGDQNIPPIWRYEGNGQLATGPNGTVGYDYTRGDPGDQGNIYFVRSTDNGQTWGAPLRLNGDAGTRAQWMPALAETASGRLVATWYDRRNTTNDDYERFGRVSTDGGATWGPEQTVSDQVIPQPAQPDPNVQACYAGDYNLNFTLGNSVLDAWTDGRVAINSTQQQDVFLDAVPTARSLTVNKTGSGSGAVTSAPAGINCGATCSSSFDPGAQVTLAAAPAAGSAFAGWSGGGCAGTGTCQVTMSADQTVSAAFKLKPPNTKITKAKVNQRKRKATFRFKAVGRATRFQCKLTNQSRKLRRWRKCSSPRTYKKLKVRKHVFSVRAVGPGGKDPTPAKKRFKIRRR
jgi:Divergent InlB B-repeat domain